MGTIVGWSLPDKCHFFFFSRISWILASWQSRAEADGRNLTSLGTGQQKPTSRKKDLEKILQFQQVYLLQIWRNVGRGLRISGCWSFRTAPQITRYTISVAESSWTRRLWAGAPWDACSMQLQRSSTPRAQGGHGGHPTPLSTLHWPHHEIGS